MIDEKLFVELDRQEYQSWQRSFFQKYSKQLKEDSIEDLKN